MTNVANQLETESGLTTWLHLIYGLHAVGLISGLVGSSFIVGSFLLGLPSIIALILGYVHRDRAGGMWLESHFQWQIRTFWKVAIAVLLLWLISIPLMLVIVGFALLPLGLIVIGIWAMYRIGRGWWNLTQRTPMPAQ